MDNLEQELDNSISELEKSLSGDTAKSEEELAKAKKEKKEEEEKEEEKEEGEEGDEKETKGCKEEESEETKGSKKEEEEEDEETKGSKEDDDEETKGSEKEEEVKGKKLGKSVEESLKSNAEAKNALEVSDFLSLLVKSLSEKIEHLEGEISSLRKSSEGFKDAMVKSMRANAEFTKSLGDTIENFGDEPKAIKSKGKSLEKAFRGNTEEGAVEMSKSQINDKLVNLEVEGKIPAGSVSRFEVSGLMSEEVKGALTKK